MEHKILSFILIYYFLININIKSVRNLPEISTLCPYNDFCTTSAIKEKQPKDSHLYPCCQKCSCEPDCQHFGNCCPDKVLDPNIQIKYPCVDLNEYYNTPRGLQGVDDVIMYRWVDDCPSTTLPSLYPRCFKIEDLEDYIAVSDPVTDRVYKNKHCALCHGVTHYKEWKLKTKCGIVSQLLNLTRSEWYSHIARKCSITPWPQKWTDGLSVKCNAVPHRAKTCNSTGRWKQNDVDIKQACETDNPYINSLFYTEKDMNYVFYKNAYCKLCNTDNNENWSDLCNPATLFGQLRASFEFTSFINYAKEDMVDQDANMNCLQTEIWDHYNSACMAVFCPASTIYIRETCEHIFITLPGQTYDLMFKVTSKMADHDWRMEDVDVINDVITRQLRNTDCYQCGTFLMEYNRAKFGVVIRYEVRSQGTCTLEFLSKQIRSMVDKPLDIDIEQGDNSSNFTITPELDADIDNFGLTLYGTKIKHCTRVKYIDRSFIDKCPRIVLPAAYMLNITSFNPKSIRGGTMCIDEYFKILNSIHNSQMQLYSDRVLLQVVFVTLYILHQYNNI